MWLAAALTAGALVAAPQAVNAADETYDYTFEFVNGVTLDGSATDKTHFLAGAGGTSATNPTGMEVHLSCSDEFEGGWGEKDGPEQGVDSAWQIDSFTISKIKDGKVDKTCGGTDLASGGNSGGLTGDCAKFMFRFEFVNGTVIESCEKDGYLPGAGGTSATNPTGMEVHLSCSDEFPGGWGEKDGPDRVADSAWQIASYFIMKDGKVKCGDTFGPPPPPPNPAIDLEKAVNGFDADDPTGPEVNVGDTVVFSYVVTNTGNVDLTNVALVDETFGPVGCPSTELAVGDSMSCDENSKVVTMTGQQGMDSTVTADGEISAGDPVALAGGQDEAYVYSFTFVNGTTISGNSQDKTHFIPNAGGTSVSNPTGMEVHLSCSDEFSGGWGEKDGPEQGVDTAWQIASWSIAKVKDGEVDKSCGDPFAPVTEEVSDSDPVNFIAVDPGMPSIDVEKYVNGEDADTPPGPSLPVGSIAEFTYVVTNNGDVPLTGIMLNDNVVGPLACPKTELAPGESMDCTTTTMEVEAGQQFMEACVKGMYQGEEVDDCDPVYYVGVPVERPTVDIEKFVNGEDADNPTGPTVALGSAVVFRYRVENTGTEKLNNVTVVDDHLGTIVSNIMLQPGQVRNFTRTIAATEAGPVFMESEVCGVGANSGMTVCDDDPVNFVVEPPTGNPSVDIEKFVNGEDADTPDGPGVLAGTKVTFRYRVENTGDVTLTNVTVVDDTLGTIVSGLTLEPGEVRNFRRSIIAEHPGPVFMESEVCGDGNGIEVCDDDPVHFVVVIYG